LLLRRVTKHLKEQNWTAVGIDFLIVVLGVFMGIQVQGWYESQREKQQVRNYLHRLNEDFSLSIAGTERTRAFVTENLQNLGIAMSGIRNCSVDDEEKDQFANGLFHMGKLIPAQFVDGTLEELRASGRLLLVDNENLRNAINETVREHEYQARVWPALQRRAADNRSYIADRFTFWMKGPVDGFSVVSWEELEIDLVTVCKDKVLLSRLSDLHRASSVGIDWMDRNLRNFRRVQKYLNEELNRHDHTSEQR
jgi:hypothetical protein